MSAPLLEIADVSVRFGGLAAVSDVSLSVKEGEIFAIIGPNGAGKTTLFNAVAGVNDPTEGEVRLSGERLERRPAARDYVRWTLAALAMGVTLSVLAANPDRLWAASVRGNYIDRKTGFSTRDAVRDFVDQLAGAPMIERRAGRYYVTTAQGQMAFGSSLTKAESRAQREKLLEMGLLPDSAIGERDGKFLVTSDGRVFDEAPTRPELELRLNAAQQLVSERSRARLLHAFAGVLGLAIGAVGAWAVARQTRRTPSWIARRGIARTFQNIRLFRDMSVLENLLAVLRLPPSRAWVAHLLPIAAAALLLISGIAVRYALLPQWLSGVLLIVAIALAATYTIGAVRRGAFSKAAVEREASARRQARELLDFVGLRKRADELAKNLPYGDQRRLEIARALATRPKLLLLDEPAAGMNPAESRSLMDTIKKIRERGITVLLIEHHMRVVMGISDRVAVLQHGKKIAEGTPDEVRNDPAVIEAYLGKEDEA